MNDILYIIVEYNMCISVITETSVYTRQDVFMTIWVSNGAESNKNRGGGNRTETRRNPVRE